MRSLVAETDPASHRLLVRMLSRRGECDSATDGQEVIEAYRLSCRMGQPYDLLCLDVKLPGPGGATILRQIRRIDAERGMAAGAGAKVVMTAERGEPHQTLALPGQRYDVCLLKPIERHKLLEVLALLDVPDDPARAA